MEYGDDPPLIWSLSCKLRGDFCRRGAVMHYREARLGAMPDSGSAEKRINQLHRIIPESKYLRQLLLRTMREIFYRGGDDPQTLHPLAAERLENDFRRMVFGDARQIISTLYAHDCSVDTLRKKLRETLWSYCNRLQDDAWDDLLRIPVTHRRFIASPLLLNINELECYASPLLAYSDRGRLRIVELRAGNIAAFAPEVMLMHRFYALNTSGRAPESVISCQLDTENGALRELAGEFDISETLRQMTADAAAFREDMSKAPEHIPRNTGSCRQCVFASCCMKNK